MRAKLFSAIRRTKGQLLPRKCFISHAYANREICGRLLATLPSGTRAIVYPPITVPPEQLVSTPLIEALRECDGLIYLAGAASERSFWVAFERDYALRLNKPVYAADVSTLQLSRCTDAPLDLAVFASYVGQDRDRVRAICDFMRRERNFDVWIDFESLAAGENWRESIQGALPKYSGRGYVVAFWSEAAASSKHIFRRLRFAAQRIGDFNDWALFALLEDARLPDFWMRYRNRGCRYSGIGRDRKCSGSTILWCDCIG